MTPEREKYLAECSERELNLRKEITEIKGVLVAFKWKLNSKDDFYFSNTKRVNSIYRSIRRLKHKLTAYRHELHRLKGIDRVVVPRVKFSVKEIRGSRYTGKKSYYATCKCGNEFLYSGNGEDYCPNCGRKILWERVMK